MKVVVRGQTFLPMASAALSETEYERLLVQEATRIFPGYRLVEFKTTVQSEYGPNQSDFALIQNEYLSWWVVEIELAHHSFSGHVFPQVRSLAFATYGPAEADYLCSRDNSLDRARLGEMMLGAQPRVLVVANGDVPSWRESMAAFDALIMRARVFVSERDAMCLVVSGEIPALTQAVISRCVPNPLLGRAFLLVESPVAVPVQNGESLHIEYEGVVTAWSRVDTGDTVWLYPAGGSNLVIKRPVDLVLRDDGGLRFRAAQQRP